MKRKTLILVSCFALVTLGTFLVLRQSSEPAMNLRPSTAVGQVLAEETSRLLGGAGNVVVLARDRDKDNQSAGGEQLASFKAAMARRASPKIIATEWLHHPNALAMNAGDLTSEQLLQLLEKNPEANSLVLFAGLPPFSPPLAQKLAARSVKLLAVCGYSPNVRRWLEARSLALAVVPRFGELPSGTPSPKTAKDWFGQEFQLLTPESVGGLPY